MPPKSIKTPETTKGYFQLHMEHEKIYGERTVILYQIGSFYEMMTYDTRHDSSFYELNDVDETVSLDGVITNNDVSNSDMTDPCGKGREVAGLIHIHVRIVKPERCGGLKYIYTAGFPTAQLEKYLQRIMNVNYIAIVYKQQMKIHGGKEVVEDRVIEIISTPATSIQYGVGSLKEVADGPVKKCNTNTYIMYLYIETNHKKQREFTDLIYFESLTNNQQDKLLKEIPVVIGIAALDVFTGRNIIYQIHSKEDNQLFALHELYRFTIAHKPRELLMFIEGLEVTCSPSVISADQLNLNSVNMAAGVNINNEAEPSSSNSNKPSGDIIDTNPNMVILQSNINNINLNKDDENNKDKDDEATQGGNKKRKSFQDIYRDFIINYLELGGIQNGPIVHPLQVINPEYCKISYQQETLKKLFPDQNGINRDNIIEYLGLSRYPEGTAAYIALLNYCHKHDNIILTKLQSPQTRWKHDRLVLAHNAIDQLDLYKEKKGESIDSLIEIIDETLTAMGSRFLHDRLFNPLTNVNDLEASYQRIEILVNNKELLDSISNILKSIPDIEKLHVRLIRGIILPRELARLYIAYRDIPALLFKLVEYPVFKSLFITDENGAQFNECLAIVNGYLNIDKLKNVRGKSEAIPTDYLIGGIDHTLDLIQAKIKETEAWFHKTAAYLTSIKAKKTKAVEYAVLKVKKDNKTSGTDKIECLYTTKVSAEDVMLNAYHRMDHQLGDMSMRIHGNNAQLLSPMINHQTNTLNKLRLENKEYFIKWYNQIVLWLQQRSSFMDPLIMLISNLDYSRSWATCAKIYKYCRPVAVESEVAFFELKGMRHPLKERIDTSPYVANDLTLNDECRGILVEGVNASGKTMTIKTPVNCIIMAQMGGFVSADAMRFSPYENIVVRLKGIDDMLHSKSSFDIEIEDLDTILRNQGKKSLVIADELCKGTETHSALALTASTMLELLKTKTTFLFSTHLHDLDDKELFHEFDQHPEMKVFHMDSERKPETNLIYYNYKILPGPSHAIYGLEVARSKGLKPSVLLLAETFRKRIIGEGEHILSTEKSRYNSKIYKDHCAFCGTVDKTDLHDHHIVPQQMADSDGFIGHFHKNATHNQIILCAKCHVALHSGKLKFERVRTNGGYIDQFTS